MAIMLTPDQVPGFWEAIKYGVVNAEMVEESKRETFFNKLLYELLAGKAQCFIRLSEDRKLQMLGITTVKSENLSDDKILFCYGLYSFAKVGFEVWVNDFKALVNWAKVNKCKSIVAWSNNEKAIGIFKEVGCEKKYEIYSYELGGV